MTKRELINALEALDIDDNTVVLLRHSFWLTDSEGHDVLDTPEVELNEDSIVIW